MITLLELDADNFFANTYQKFLFYFFIIFFYLIYIFFYL